MSNALRLVSLSTAIVLAWSVTASASIVYVDADHNTNTAPESGSPTLPQGPINTQGASGDGLWDLRAFSNGGTIYQNRGFNGGDSTPEDAHRLVTTISGLTSGSTYSVYAYFWTDGQWRINAGLTNGILPHFDSNTPAAVATDFAAPAPIVTESNRTMLQASLGTMVADGNGEIAVYIDDNDPVTTDQVTRTWYDGVGYKLVPEPTSISMLLLGASAIGFVRRR